MFYTLQKPTTPAWAKTVIVGALGYFILPIDLIPDLIPGGYTEEFIYIEGLGIATEEGELNMEKLIKRLLQEDISVIYRRENFPFIFLTKLRTNVL
ncbi:DUF1232 domain-containing protein [Peribacillus castrilensis]